MNNGRSIPDPAGHDLIVPVRSGRLRVLSAVMVLILIPVIVSVVVLLVGLPDAPAIVIAALVLPLVFFLGAVGSPVRAWPPTVPSAPSAGWSVSACVSTPATPRCLRRRWVRRCARSC